MRNLNPKPRIILAALLLQFAVPSAQAITILADARSIAASGVTDNDVRNESAVATEAGFVDSVNGSVGSDGNFASVGADQNSFVGNSLITGSGGATALTENTTNFAVLGDAQSDLFVSFDIAGSYAYRLEGRVNAAVFDGAGAFAGVFLNSLGADPSTLIEFVTEDDIVFFDVAGVLGPGSYSLTAVASAFAIDNGLGEAGFLLDLNLTAVPLPAAGWLLFGALGGLGLRRRRST